MSDILLVLIGGTLGGLLGALVNELIKLWFRKRK